MSQKYTAVQRDQIAADAARRYDTGETWAQIAASYDLSADYVRRLTTARHPVTFRRWGQRPLVDPAEAAQRRSKGHTVARIAEDLQCSRQAVRTALQAAGYAPATRYPRLGARRDPSEAELETLAALYSACPPGIRARPGARDIRGEEGRALAQACHDVVADGVPMATLSTALGRGPTWVHWLLGVHGVQLPRRPVRSTLKRSPSPASGMPAGPTDSYEASCAE